MIYLLGSYGVILTSIWLVAKALDDTLSSETKTNLAERLRGSSWLRAWPEEFIRLFDFTFGEKHLTWKCFRRSCYASLLALGAVMLVAYSFRPPDIDRILFVVGQGDWAFAILGILVIVNCLFDYVSLLETRWLLRFAISASGGRQILILAMDVVLTACVISTAFAFNALGRFIFPTIITVDPITHGSLPGLAAHHLDYVIKLMSLRLPEGEFQLGVFAYSTYATSAWLWLFLVTSVAMRIIWAIMRAFHLRELPFDLAKKPVQSLATVACIAIALTFPAFLVFHSILKSAYN